MTELKPRSTERDQMIERFIPVLEKNEFHELKARYNGSPFSIPTHIFEYMPDITAKDRKDRFFIFDFSDTSDLGLDYITSMWSAYAKYARIHHSKFWIIVPKGLEEKTDKICTKLDIRKDIAMIKGMST